MTLVAAGCVSKETTAIPGPKYPTADSYCKALAEAVCAQTVVEACFLSSSSTLADDTATCVANYQQGGNCNPAGHGYDVAAAETCIARIASVYADAKVNLDELAKYPDLVYTAEGRVVCISAFNAAAGQDAACSSDQDCDVGQGLACVTKGAETGSCQTPEIVAAAEVCSGPTQVCDEAEDLYCGSDNQCIRKPDVGGACSLVAPFVPCRDNALCVMDICTPKAANADPCTDNEQCEGGFCVRPTGSTNGTCGAQLVLAPTTAMSCEPFIGQQPVP
jgi:hypothetical protein